MLLHGSPPTPSHLLKGQTSGREGTLQIYVDASSPNTSLAAEAAAAQASVAAAAEGEGVPAPGLEFTPQHSLQRRCSSSHHSIQRQHGSDHSLQRQHSSSHHSIQRQHSGGLEGGGGSDSAHGGSGSGLRRLAAGTSSIAEAELGDRTVLL